MNIIYCQDVGRSLREVLSDMLYSSCHLLMDDNTYKYCYPQLVDKIPRHQNIIIQSGENNKTLTTVEYIWQGLFEQQADRQSILVVVGGGMLTDIGGFAANTFKRGMRAIFIPTTLLGIVDACYGGKTGINYHQIKNQIGTFFTPEKILIEPKLLNTLPSNEWLSGYGEILKYGLLTGGDLWNILLLKKMEDVKPQLKEIIQYCLNHKIDIVNADPFEQSSRKSLNIGHTFAHALESYYFSEGLLIPHGYAVALGLAMCLYLSKKKYGFSRSNFIDIIDTLKLNYHSQPIDKEGMEKMYQSMLSDKKNNQSQIKFVLLQQMAKPLIDIQCGKEEIFEAIEFHNDLWK